MTRGTGEGGRRYGERQHYDYHGEGSVRAVPEKHLDGKVAIVTGGAGGMGSWICKIFAEQGARVIVADTGADVEGRMGMDSARVDAVVKEITDAGGTATGMIGDVAEMEQAERLVSTALERYGRLDILVCAHGILRDRMIFNMTEDDWDGSIRAHLKGCFTTTKFAAIHWRQTRAGGRVIYFTSAAGIRGSAGQPNYSAAQQAKVGLMLSNARALGRYGVTANCISPLASTRMTDSIPSRDGQGSGSTAGASESAVGTATDPKNVVPVIVFLASDAGAEVTGRVFGATGHRISVWHEPEWESAIYSETPFWDIDKLFEVMPEALNARGWDLPPMQI
jgi:NAD(P)-dependent dehydrogenase (short-subunit alcohol dehydrogenase family)